MLYCIQRKEKVMENYKYRALNPRNEEDVNKYFKLVCKLSDFCNDNNSVDENMIKWVRVHMGAVELVNPAYKNKPLPPLDENADEFVFVCEVDGKLIGYIGVCSYHIVDGQCPDDDIGILHEIFVLDEYRNGTIAYTLLQMAIDKLIEKGKNRAICNVQEDNPNRFLHFAMANNNVIKEQECTRKNGTKTTDYTLLIDLHNLKNTSITGLAKKTAQIKKERLLSKTQEDSVKEDALLR